MERKSNRSSDGVRPSPSLGEQATRRMREGWGRIAGGDARNRPEASPRTGSGLVTLVLALLIVSVPASVWAGSFWLTRSIKADNARMRAELQPRDAATEAHRQARARLSAMLDRPVAAKLIEAIANAIPADARIVALTRDAMGRVTLQIKTADPAQLRQALHQSPAFADWKTENERRVDAGMIVTIIGDAG